MEKNQRRSLIIIAVLFVGIVCAVGQYMGAFNAMYVLATNPNPGHTWNQMECSTGLCVDTVNNRVGVGTTSPQTNLHVVGGFKVGSHTTCDSSTGAWNFTTPVSVPGPTVSNHAATKGYVDSCVHAITTCVSSFTDPRDGNSYSSALIGCQCWMTENLKYLPSVVGPATESSSSPCYYVYGYDGTNVATAKATTNYSTYGALYNYKAAQTACPSGWHLPSDAEYQTLEMYLGMTQYDANLIGWRGSPVGTILKTGDFNALMSGFRSDGGNPNPSSFLNIGTETRFWCVPPSFYYYRGLSNNYTSVYRYSTPFNAAGHSVRCIKD